MLVFGAGLQPVYLNNFQKENKVFIWVFRFVTGVILLQSSTPTVESVGYENIVNIEIV